MADTGKDRKGTYSGPGEAGRLALGGQRSGSRAANLCPPPPQVYVIESLTVCGLHCQACHLGAGHIDRQGQLLAWEDFVTVADKIRPYARLVYPFQWGEPLLHPRIFDMIEYLKQFSRVIISTTGTTLTPEKASRLIATGVDTVVFDFDGLDKQTYESFRHGGSFEKARTGLRHLVEARNAGKGRTDITLQFIVTQRNQHQISQVQALAESLQVYLSLKSAYFFDVAQARALLPSAPQWRRYHLVDGRLALKFDRWQCREAWRTFYVLVNGDVNPCCYDYNGTLRLGNLLQQSLLEVWHGPGYQDFRRAFREGRQLPTLCQEHCHQDAPQHPLARAARLVRWNLRTAIALRTGRLVARAERSVP